MRTFARQLRRIAGYLVVGALLTWALAISVVLAEPWLNPRDRTSARVEVSDTIVVIEERSLGIWAEEYLDLTPLAAGTRATDPRELIPYGMPERTQPITLDLRGARTVDHRRVGVPLPAFSVTTWVHGTSIVPDDQSTTETNGLPVVLGERDLLLPIQPTRGAIVNTLVLAGVSWFVTLIFRAWRARRRHERHCCINCGQQLVENTVRCSECGHPVPRDAPLTSRGDVDSRF